MIESLTKQHELKSIGKLGMHTNIERNHWLDSLRGVAAMWVVLHHLNLGKFGSTEANFYTSFVEVGWLGVPIFFILSGYCIGMVTEKVLSIREFLLRRFFRIFPPYYASIAVVLLVITIRIVDIGSNDVAVLPTTLKELAATFTLMTMPATEVETINGVYWSLTYEVVFYLIVALVLKAKSHDSLVYLSLTLVCFVPGLYESVGSDRGGAVEGIFFLKEWFLFATGLGLYQFTKHNSKVTGALFLLNFIGIVYTKDVLVTLVSIFTLGSIYLSQLSFLNTKNYLSNIGKYSYSLYLIHVPIGNHLLLQYRKGLLFDNLYLHILYDVTVLSILIGLSYLFYESIEKPSISFGKAFIKKNSRLTKTIAYGKVR